MKEIVAHIESNMQGLYSIYVEEDLAYSVIGDGKTIDEAKADFLAVYEASRADHKERTGEDIAYTFRFVMDVTAFLQSYKGYLTLSGLSQLTGINKTQLSQYVCGKRHPSERTEERIKEAVESFAEELSRVFA